MNNRTANHDARYLGGPSLIDNTSGRGRGAIRPDESEGAHGMKGIIGKGRAKTYSPSSYGSGDSGGAAGGFGVHGATGQVMEGAQLPTNPGEASDRAHGLRFEGGIRGANISEQETMPAQYHFDNKNDLNREDDRGTVHGQAGVEGMKAGAPPKRGYGNFGMDPDNVVGDHGMDSEEENAAPPGGDHGFGCHGCGAKAKTSHGLARHMKAKHGFKGLGHALTSGQKTHGTSYKAGQQFRGETENPEQYEKIADEYQSAKNRFKTPENARSSSYTSGDHSGRR